MDRSGRLYLDVIGDENDYDQMPELELISRLTRGDEKALRIWFEKFDKPNNP